MNLMVNGWNVEYVNDDDFFFQAIYRFHKPKPYLVLKNYFFLSKTIKTRKMGKHCKVISIFAHSFGHSRAFSFKII